VSTPRLSLRQQLNDYLDLRRALGFKLANAGRLLGQFVDYLADHDLDAVTIEEALAWAMLPDGASRHWWAIRISVVRGFAAYLHSIDPAVQVPPAGLIHAGSCRATPYLYSDTEIRARGPVTSGGRWPWRRVGTRWTGRKRGRPRTGCQSSRPSPSS
jgi:integrase/recombinase XerD